MPVEAWALFCVTELVVCLQPGPSAFVVVSQSLTRGPSAGVWWTRRSGAWIRGWVLAALAFGVYLLWTLDA